MYSRPRVSPAGTCTDENNHLPPHRLRGDSTRRTLFHLPTNPEEEREACLPCKPPGLPLLACTARYIVVGRERCLVRYRISLAVVGTAGIDGTLWTYHPVPDGRSLWRRRSARETQFVSCGLEVRRSAESAAWSLVEPALRHAFTA